jgi:hypothetical protein
MYGMHYEGISWLFTFYGSAITNFTKIFTSLNFFFTQYSLWLQNWTARVWCPEEAKDFSSSLCVQTSSLAYPAFYPLGTSDPFPGVKLGQGVMLTTHAHLVPRSRMSRSYISSPSWHLHGGSGRAFLRFTFILRNMGSKSPYYWGLMV